MDVSFLTTIFSDALPIAPELIVIVGALIAPLFYFITKDGKWSAIIAEIAIILAAAVAAIAYGVYRFFTPDYLEDFEDDFDDDFDDDFFEDESDEKEKND